MRNRILLTAAVFVLLGFLPTDAQTKGSTVYVCACLGNQSCQCMTEAKTEGPCACGTHGGPPLKAVPASSDWAKHNREELAK